jgi:serine/threonine-protein kinase
VFDREGPSEWLALTPDGSAVVMSEAEDLPGRTLFVRRLDDLMHTPILGSEGAVDPVVSPDGTLVAWGGGNGVYAAPLAGGTRRTLAPTPGACCLRWGDDGYVSYSSGADNQLYRVRATGGEPEALLGPGAEDLLPEYATSLDGGARVLYGSRADRTIRLLDVASGEVRDLVQGQRPFPVDEEYLIFARASEGVAQIYGARLDVDGMALVGSPVLLVEGVGAVPREDPHFTVSASGDLAYWTPTGLTGTSHELVWVDRAGTATSVDTTWTPQIESMELSPDGTRAAITVSVRGIAVTEIWIKELDGGPARRLTNYQGMNRRAVWSPDGTTLAFISDRGGRRAVWSVPVDGIATPELLLEHPDADIDEVAWSRDGAWFVYRTGTTLGGRDVYARQTGAESQPVAVSAQPGVDERSPVLSPDGRWVAYVSDESGRDEVWVRPFPDVDRGSRQVSFSAGVEPEWSDGGGELFFRMQGGFASVAVGDGETLSVGTPQRLFSNQVAEYNVVYRSFDHDAGGDRFLMARRYRQLENNAELILVENFLEEMKARLGG